MKDHISLDKIQTKHSELIYENPINKLPLLILLLNNKCNSRCITCSYWIKEDKKEIPINNIENWIKDWYELGVKRIVLTGGEPLIHSEIINICKILVDSGFEITILTNGLLLEKYAHQIAKFCKNYIISLNGPELIHNNICNIKNAFKKLKSGVEAIKIQDNNIKITGRCTVQKENFMYMRKVVNTSLILGLNRISFLAADISSTAFNRNNYTLNDESISSIILNPDEIKLLEDEILSLETDYIDFFKIGYIVETPDLLRKKILNYYKAIINQGEFSQIECNCPWVSAVINFDLDVLPCFFQASMGSLNSEPNLSKIINSNNAVSWREYFSVQENTICQRCVCPMTFPFYSAK
ncbi:MAG: radical SAM protein [Bacteroidales bacterium]|nr:radical SAM protein [Bacteroidales bacterium]